MSTSSLLDLLPLYHYSWTPFVLDPARTYEQDEHNIKPVGLWLSVDEEWRKWCEEEEFRIEDLTLRTRIVLTDEAHVLHLDTPKSLYDFTAQFSRPSFLDAFHQIDWPAVARAYQGLLIAPYQWSCRLDQRVHWYYGWDCASGCIWDLTAIKEATSCPSGGSCLVGR